jgi:hypothetical protein
MANKDDWEKMIFCKRPLKTLIWKDDSSEVRLNLNKLEIFLV